MIVPSHPGLAVHPLIISPKRGPSPRCRRGFPALDGLSRMRPAHFPESVLGLCMVPKFVRESLGRAWRIRFVTLAIERRDSVRLEVKNRAKVQIMDWSGLRISTA